MKKENWFLIGLILAAILLLFFYPNFGLSMQTFLYPVKGQSPDVQKKLILENESLKVEIALLGELKKNLPAHSGDLPVTRLSNGLPVFVYSRYPLNFKSELLVSAGKNADVEIGQSAVIVSNSSSSRNLILAGKVEKVLENTSIIETIFDARFQSAVRIGKSGTNALFKGGNEPTLSLIPRDAQIENGDVVYSASSDFAYGLPVGILGNLRVSSDKLFQVANVEINFNPNELQSLFILTNAYGAK